VGTGFSFTDSDDGYARNEEDVARDLYVALQQFFTLFPEYRERDFYMTGESYAGKYVPAISYKIHQENQEQRLRRSGNLKINFKGMAIGDGFSDPENMLYYGEYLYGVGLLDEMELGHFQKEQDKARLAIKEKRWIDAFTTIDRLMDGDLNPPSYFKNTTGLDFYFNLLIAKSPPEHGYYSPFVQQSYVRRAIHVGNTSYAEDTKVETNLREDMYQSVRPWIEELLDAPESYKVLIYSGQLDIIVANTLTCSMLRHLKWSGAAEYVRSPRKIWHVNDAVAGYAKTTRNLTFVTVRNAGHMIPYDQPKWAFDMISRWTAGKSFA
jgi:vitellogenic carboxypeptidase-like protein